MRRFPPTRWLLPGLILALAIACGGGGEDTDSQSTDNFADTAQGGSVGSSGSGASPSISPDPVIAGPPTPTPPRFAGYDLEFAEGDFWRFKWEFSDRSCAQGSGCNTDRASGEFQLTLGPSKEWKGATVFAVDASGSSGYVDGATTRDFKLAWTYIGIVDGRIVGTNGFGDSPLVTLFDARTGKWPGSGFFTSRFSNDDLFEAIPGVFGQSNEFAAWAGLQAGNFHYVRAARSQGKCETIEGRNICPREESFSYTETEYYRPGIGPFAYQYSNTASFSGGGFTTSFQTVERVALIDSSFTGSSRVEIAADSPDDQAQPSTPPAAVAALPDPIFGPIDGGLELAPGSVNIPDFSSGLNVDSGIVLVTFENPDVPGNQWSHGITFRQSSEETFHAVFIRGDGTWGHFARGGSVNNEITTAQGQFDFDTAPGSQNHLSVLVADLAGIFFINGEQVAVLDLSFAAALAPGDIRVMSGLFPTDELNGATTFFTGFAVYDVPES